ncbi:MAG: polymer-forming cytoskeletal protein [Bacteroidetes bacterium]|nr:polymer-forming cytoskeletal protein [Bacteroidota bacterium]
MFTKNKSKEHYDYPSGAVSTIAAGTTVNGDIESESDMRIDGNIIGHVYCKAKVVLGESGIVQGDLFSGNADIFGTVNGNVVSKDMLCLKSKATINGNIQTARLQIDPNAVFNGQCKMTSDHAPQVVPEKKAVVTVD